MAQECEYEAFDFRAPDFSVTDFQEASFCVQFKQLMFRTRVGLRRNPLAVRARLGQNIVFGLLALGVFQELQGTSKKEKYNMAGCLFFMSVNTFMLNFVGTIGLFQQERPVFLREQASRMYRLGPYFQAKTLVEFPVTTLLPMIYVCLLYYGVHFRREWDAFFFQYFILWTLVQSAISIGYLVSSLFKNESTAAMIGPLLILPFMVFSGFYSNMTLMPWYVLFWTWLSPMRYGMEALCHNEWNYQATGDEFDLQGYLGFTFGMWNCVYVLLFMAVICRVLAYLGLRQLTGKFEV